MRSALPSHVDLSRRAADGRSSTHTFVLYLSTCAAGGETRLLSSVGRPRDARRAGVHSRGAAEEEDGSAVGGSADESGGWEEPGPSAGREGNADAEEAAGWAVVAAVKPKRGRLLIFPHLSPHDGAEVVTPPKLLLRGDML